MTFPTEKTRLVVSDDGAGDARRHMEKDAALLIDESPPPLQLRFFQMDQPTVTFGYLLDEKAVAVWAKPFGEVILAKRPTGGGAVFHRMEDLSFSLLWPRHKNIFPENPREAYKALHTRVLAALKCNLSTAIGEIGLKAPGPRRCDTSAIDTRAQSVGPQRFSACFEEPVCHDIMRGPEKILGGALRFTKAVVLYQGHLRLPANTHLESLKNAIAAKIAK